MSRLSRPSRDIDLTTLSRARSKVKTNSQQYATAQRLLKSFFHSIQSLLASVRTLDPSAREPCRMLTLRERE